MSWYSSARRGVCLPYSAKRGKVRFFDASGATVVLVDKVAILDNNDQIVAGVVFPVPVEIACDVIGWEVDTANHGSRGARPASVGRDERPPPERGFITGLSHSLVALRPPTSERRRDAESVAHRLIPGIPADI